LVQFHLSEEEQAVTELLAAAGGATHRIGSLYLAACDDETLATLRWATDGVP
jgi:hypothetical protein